MSEPRRVTITLPAIKGLTILEIARASAIAGIKRDEAERLLRSLINPASDPADLERGAELLYAWAMQLVKRDEPGVTWAEAQTWRLEFDLEATDEGLIDAEADATVRAAAATGLSPAEAGKLTVAEMVVYSELAELAGSRSG